MINAGTKLGPYEVLSPLGAGGMGEVYRARDTRLDRTVAIKVLPDRFADRAELRERFEREARTIASLNHPNICTLHDIGHQDGTDYLVMELLEGETLAQRLEKGPLPLDQMLTYAVQIADALDKAHRKGVTHRDLKPGNIVLTKSGAKLLDFGLAKLRQEASPATAVSQLPTMSQPITAQGTIVGTLQYMAPEQLEGKEADARTDIFAFGAVVYEMATGKRAFEGKSQASIIAKILESDPQPMTSLQPMTPPALDRAVKKCLAKDPDERWQTARDLHNEMKWISEPASQTASRSGFLRKTKARGGWRQIALWSSITAAAAAAVAIAATWDLKSSPVPSKPVTRFTITLPAGQRLATESAALALSPDGSQLAFVATPQGSSVPQIYLRAMVGTEAKPISGTEGATEPFFSPDGQWLGFIAAGKLKKISVSGGVAQALADDGFPAGGSWGSKGTIVFAGASTALLQISDNGGAPQPATRLEKGELFQWSPEFLPSGKEVVFAAIGPSSSAIAVQQIGTNGRRNVIEGQEGSTPRYASSGYLIYGQAGNLVAVPFDPDRLQVKGPTVTSVQGVLQASMAPRGPQYSLSTTGTLVYIPGAAAGTESKMVWVSRSGTEQPLAAPMRAYDQPRLSLDGRRIAVGASDSEGTQVWLYDLRRETLSRFTFEESHDLPVWTPDGRRIAFSSTLGSAQNIFWQPSDGSGGLERLTGGKEEVAYSWSPDGRLLMVVDTSGGVTSVLRVGDHQAQPFVPPASVTDALQFSPDGRWIA